MSKLGNLKRKIEAYFFGTINSLESPFAWKPTIMSEMETLDYIIKNKVSISRFGDGEFKWMLGIPQNTFQAQSDELKNELLNAYHFDDERLLICIPPYWGNLKKYKFSARGFWAQFMVKYRNKIKKLSLPSYKYGNLDITRFYNDFNNTNQVTFIIDKWREVWKDRNIIIIEGEFTRMGVGNDLFKTSRSIKRILAPSKNAFSKSYEIFSYVTKNIDKDDLILFALGPTATILAARLSQCDYQVLDVGHIDIEYEWYLTGAKEKVPVKNKYVHEASHLGGAIVSDIEDLDVKKEYMNQIIARIL